MLLDLHRLAEERSLALHEEIARRVWQDPAAGAEALLRVRRWRETGALSSEYVAQWTALLNAGFAHLRPPEGGRAQRIVARA